MILTFYLTFASLGPWLSGIMSFGIDWWTDRLETFLSWLNVCQPLKSLIIDGICAGVGSVLSFIPVIGILFFCLGILEESGYLYMVATIMDRALSKIKIPGQSFVPMLMGFGCSVPAILATGNIQNRRQKLLTISLIPFMSCSAKLPVYSMIIPVFFPGSSGAVTFSLYITGIMLAILFAIVYNKVVPEDTGSCKDKSMCSCKDKGTCSCRAEGIPPFKFPFKFPCLKRAFIYLWENVKGFVKKAFTVIFIASMVVWFAENFTTDLQWTSNPDNSILASAGKFIAPVFAPLGFGDWRAAAAVMAGLSAKEALVSTLSVLSGVSGGNELSNLLMQTFTPLSAFSFMVFCLLYAPCIASLAAIRRETGSFRYAIGVFIFQTIIAWLTAFIIFNTGGFLFNFL